MKNKRYSKQTKSKGIVEKITRVAADAATKAAITYISENPEVIVEVPTKLVKFARSQKEPAQQKNLEVFTEVVLIRCPKCKTKNDEDAKYCKECGKKLI